MSRIVLRNRTEYDDAEVARLVRFAFADLELPAPFTIVVRVGHTRVSDWRRAGGEQYVYGASGRAWDCVFEAKDVPRNAAYEVHLNVGKPDDFPVAWYDRYDTGFETLEDWQDALVAIAAHEGKHIETYQLVPGRRARRDSGLSNRAEEARCDAYAARRLREFKLHEKHAICEGIDERPPRKRWHVT